MVLPPMCDFLTSCIDYLENTGSLSYADHPNINTLQYTISKVLIFLISTPVSWAVLKYFGAVKIKIQVFQTSQFF